MTWGAIGAATVGVVGGALVGGQPSQSVASSDPWVPQQQYLTHGFGQAQDALTKGQNAGDYYTGQRVADLNPWQTQGYSTVGSFAQNQGMGAADSLMKAGQGTINYGAQFGDNAASLYRKLNGADPTQQIIGNAGLYADNPYLDSQIDAASRDVVRNLTEQQLPGLDLAAAGSGNMNSSRTGVAEGIMARGAQDRIGDIAAQMRGNAYLNGLGMSQNQYNTGISQQMLANGQLLSAGDFGRIATDAGLNAGYGAGDAMARAGAGFQTQQQNVLNAQQQAFKDQQTAPLDLVGKYMSIINGNYGGTNTSSSGGGTAGAVQGALTGGMGGLGLYGKFSQPSYSSFINNNQGFLNSSGLTADELLRSF